MVLSICFFFRLQTHIFDSRHSKRGGIITPSHAISYIFIFYPLSSYMPQHVFGLCPTARSSQQCTFPKLGSSRGGESPLDARCLNIDQQWTHAWLEQIWTVPDANHIPRLLCKWCFLSQSVEARSPDRRDMMYTTTSMFSVWHSTGYAVLLDS